MSDCINVSRLLLSVSPVHLSLSSSSRLSVSPSVYPSAVSSVNLSQIVIEVFSNQSRESICRSVVRVLTLFKAEHDDNGGVSDGGTIEPATSVQVFRHTILLLVITVSMLTGM